MISRRWVILRPGAQVGSSRLRHSKIKPPVITEYPNYPELWYQYYTADSQQSGVVLPGSESSLRPLSHVTHGQAASDYPYNFDSTSALSVYYDNLRAMNSNTFESPWPSPEIVQTPNTPPFIYRTHGPQSWSPPASSSNEPTPDGKYILIKSHRSPAKISHLSL